MHLRLVLAVTLGIALSGLFGGATGASASPGSLRILIVGNDLDPSDVDVPSLSAAILAVPGVGAVDSFDSSMGTPPPATLATYDLVVGTGDDVYADPAAWGNELADYLDAGGAEIQFAYDNWNDPGASPTGRFASGGYAPFNLGPNPNTTTTLGAILVPGSPLLAGVPTLTTNDNTTDTVAPGATLLANWADGRAAIATKGRVVSVTASLDSGNFSPASGFAQLIVNAGNVLGRHALTVAKSGSGSGTVTSAPAGISCGPTCLSYFANGSAVALSAAPDAGSSFAGWSGAGCSGTSTCTVALNAAQAVTATFNLLRPTGTKITKARINKRRHTASFTFTAKGTVAGFQCALVKPAKKGKHHKKRKPAFKSCTSPKTYRHLKRGHYTFEVRAVNSVGPDLALAHKKFKI
jgi:Divergent InlB B-repeat domain